jgi:hypothetical protein
MGLLRTLFIIIAVYYAIKFIGRLAFPHILNRFMQKMENKMREQQGYTKYDETKVGETVIDKAPKSKKSNDSVGEYVDYEEVD